MSVTPIQPGPGQESVWSYPRPAIAQRFAGHVEIIHAGRHIADTRASIRTLETSHPPSYYIPPDAIDAAVLRLSARTSFCEWKGVATYVDVVLGDRVFADIGWRYADPTRAFASLRDHIAFYADPFDACLVDGARVTPQPGGFYGGWITPAVVGPFKGVPGSRFW